ncbi:histidine kinase dimerization/phospho-acceptor domain-containing protein [Anaeromyxobacter oryzisoli]|uniref:histidine kinase dimerization/phospho-acceptor domain-containing protein n=1 Tax=Anaeromyxobacter oryzisoli TaxID=2925408 RepID=UPI001F5821A3|nr:histidine kinase dimerization/phospho-acceptor domain-containing protein [Anaeromyxobacter sp. SG63]
MHTFSSGAAFIDGAGAVVGADAGFVAALGLAAEDPAGALRARAASSPELAALLAGPGRAVARVTGARGEPIELERVPAGPGALLVARSPRSAEWLEHALRSEGLTRLAAGLAHDIKNPLNAMALQLALLTDKLGSPGDATAASAGHLAALREQIGRVNEVVRRFLDVTDPTAPLGYTDLGALVADAASLFGHDARRRRVDLVVEAPRGAARTRCDPGRVGRLVLGVLARALEETPEGGRLSVRAEAEGAHAVVRIAHGAGDLDAESGYYSEVLSAAVEALGGVLTGARADGVVETTLRLPGNDRP